MVDNDLEYVVKFSNFDPTLDLDPQPWPSTLTQPNLDLEYKVVLRVEIDCFI